jgi:hypothetical protein
MPGIYPERIDFLTSWAGLYNRNQAVDPGNAFASVCRNVDFFGSAISRRKGTQLTNGWGTIVQPGWTNGATQATGPVLDASGFTVGDTVLFAGQDGTNVSGTIAAITIHTTPGASDILTMTGTISPLPIAPWAVIAQRPLAGRVDGLFHAMRRDGSQELMAAAGQPQSLWNVWGTPVGTPAGTSYDPFTLPSNHAYTQLPTGWPTWPTTATGTIPVAETLVATDGTTTGSFLHAGSATIPPNMSPDEPDIIVIQRGTTVLYEGTIAHIASTTVPAATITLTGAASSPPQAGDYVVFHPRRTGGYDTRFLQYNDFTYITSAAAALTPTSGPGVQNPEQTPPVKWDGHFWTRVSVRRPTTGNQTTIPAVLPGDPTFTDPLSTGPYQYRWKYRISATGEESEPSTPEASDDNIPSGVPLMGSYISVKIAGSPDPRVDFIDIYRNVTGNPTDGNGNGVFNFVGSIPNGAGFQEFKDTVSDNIVAANRVMREFVDNPIPNSVTYLAYWPLANRLIGIDSVNEWLVISDQPDFINGTLKGDSWPVDNTIFISRDDGDHLTGIQALFDSVIVFKGKSMWRILGQFPDIAIQPVSYRDDLTGIGTFAPKCYAADENDLVFASDDGFYELARYEGVQQGFAGDRLSVVIDNEWQDRLLFAKRANVHLVYNRICRQLRAFVPVDGNPSGEANEMFVYQFEGSIDGQPHGWSLWTPPPTPTSGKAWQLWGHDTTAACNVHRADQRDMTYYGTASGLVVCADMGTAELGAVAVATEYRTVWFSPKGGGLTCRGRAVDTVAVLPSAVPVTITLTLETDTAVFPSVAVPFTTFADGIWGVGLFGIARFGNAGKQPQPARAILFTLGNYHRLGFQEASQLGAWRIVDFTYFYQALPIFVTPRTVMQQIPSAYVNLR